MTLPPTRFALLLRVAHESLSARNGIKPGLLNPCFLTHRRSPVPSHSKCNCRCTPEETLKIGLSEVASWLVVCLP